ncbi:MAG: parallel beta-helix repeat protein, partial [Candidatus Azotimanducaceae bacterium]
MLFCKSQQNLLAVTLTLSVLFFATFINTASAAINEEINYQGKLTDTSGAAVADGTYNMRFWLLQSEAQATTSAIFTESLTTTNRVQVTNGLFSVMIGSSTSLSAVDFNQTLYLGVEIGSTTTTPVWDGEMSPRKVLGAVPAAFEANNAQTFAGIATTSFLRSNLADTASGLLTFTGGLISSASSTISSLTLTTATTTNFVINGELFTDLTGTHLSNVGGLLTVATSTITDLANLTTVGTIGSGVWQGTAVGAVYGGTGLSTITENELLIGGAGNTWTQISTSSLNIAGDGNDNSYGPTVIVAASNASNTARAQFLATGTNDQDTIEAAIASLPASGGRVQLTEGTFSINDEINITSNSIELVGMGSSTVLQITATSTSWDVIDASGVSGIAIKDLQIDGRAALAGSQNGIEFTTVSTSTIENVYVHDMRTNGADLNGSNGNILHGNRSQNNTNRGYNLSSSDNNVLTGNYSEGNTQRGIYLNGADYNTLSQNIILGNSSTGVYISDSGNNVITNNSFSNNLQGIYILSTIGKGNNNISNNNIGNSLASGISLYKETQGNVISDNVLYNNGYNGTSYSISLLNNFDEAPNDTLITNNVITATTSVSLIYIKSSDVNRTTIAGNTFSNSSLNDTNYISDAGTDTRYDQNSRRTLTTTSGVGYNLFNIYGSSSVALASSTQLGTGNIFEWGNATGDVMTLSNDGYLGLGTTSPYANLSIAATDGQSNPLLA